MVLSSNLFAQWPDCIKYGAIFAWVRWILPQINLKFHAITWCGITSFPDFISSLNWLLSLKLNKFTPPGNFDNVLIHLFTLKMIKFWKFLKQMIGKSMDFTQLIIITVPLRNFSGMIWHMQIFRYFLMSPEYQNRLYSRVTKKFICTAVIAVSGLIQNFEHDTETNVSFDTWSINIFPMPFLVVWVNNSFLVTAKLLVLICVLQMVESMTSVKNNWK